MPPDAPWNQSLHPCNQCANQARNLLREAGKGGLKPAALPLHPPLDPLRPEKVHFILVVIMRLVTLFLLTINFLNFECGITFAQTGPAWHQGSNDEASNLTWKATLMTGDDSIDAFDNARKTLTSEFLQMGVLPA